MRKCRFGEGQIIGLLREQEASTATTEVCRRHGVREQAYYPWIAAVAAMVVAELPER